MKRIFLGTITAAALVIGAQAASAADVSVPVFFNYWNGAYLGAQGGWGWTTTGGLNASGDFGGGQVGYNYQVGYFVFGLEGDGAFADIKSQTVTNTALGLPSLTGYRDDGLASLRGRFGITFQNILFYGTAGGGWVHDRFSTTTALGTMPTATAWHTGWAAGGGVEYGFLPNWSVKVEYLHYGVGNATYFGVLNTGNIGIETFKVGVNYQFR
jgi:outer membrane immunogenic protein